MQPGRIVACLLAALLMACCLNEARSEPSPAPGPTLRMEQLYQVPVQESVALRDGGCVAVAKISRTDMKITRVDARNKVAWTRIHRNKSGDRVPTSVRETPDGAFIVAGYVLSRPWRLFLARLDGKGKVLWDRTFDAPAHMVRVYATATSDGGYALAVPAYSYGDPKAEASTVVLKLDADGRKLWSHNLPRSFAGWIDAAPGGGAIVAGGAGSVKFPTAFATRLGADGKAQWTHTYDKNTHPVFIEPASDGGFIACGYAGDSSPYGAWLVKLDPAGIATWTESCFTGYSTTARAIAPGRDGGYVAAGSDGVNPGFFVVGFDATGKEAWRRVALEGASGFGAQAVSIRRLADGGHVICGYAGRYEGATHLVIVRIPPP